jgi:Uma2 family endonuclease
MVAGTQQITVEQFDHLVTGPDYADRRLEYIGGRIVEMVSNNYSSAVAALILAHLVLFVQRHRLGYVTGADGGYRVGGERYIPDVAFISKARQPVPSREAYNPNAPDLAVEVLSPTDDPGDLRLKVTNYLAAGTTVWVVDPEGQRVEVHAPGQPATRTGPDGTLDGGELLPGFTLAVRDMFPAEAEDA